MFETQKVPSGFRVLGGVVCIVESYSFLGNWLEPVSAGVSTCSGFGKLNTVLVARREHHVVNGVLRTCINRTLQ